MEILFSTNPTRKANAVVIGVYKDRIFSKQADELDQKSQGALSKALKSAEFKGLKDNALLLSALYGIDTDYVLVVGLGDKESIDEKQLYTLGGRIVGQLRKTSVTHAEIRLEDIEARHVSLAETSGKIALGSLLRDWRFDKYRTTIKEEDKPKLTQLSFIVKDAAAAKAAFEPLKKLSDGIFLTREVVSEPPNVIYPETLAEKAKELSKLGVKVEILNEKQMKALGMGALLGVGQGSIRESQLAVMQWQGGNKNDQPLAFIGKGVTFDTGGISLKPAANMDEMKADMGGAAVVMGLMKALAGRKAAINAVGVIGIVENMPSGSAQRPGDIVTTMSGQTIEVLNTDAEGRLVLADALWYTQDRFKPQLMVNLATLTGAIVVALGHEYAGLFSNNDELAERLSAAGEKMEEKLWRLPLHENYNKDIDSDVADVKNISSGRGAGSITAAQFLERFVNKMPWAHLDIAGVTWSSKDLALSRKGATAFGVRLLNCFIQDYYENQA
ncbi:MAG: leucyl aminopeptidase [Alphaproteobacteria bacterium]|nr:leucyl aminopeptidase [Alphaproteobacteria bacterium]